MGKSSKKRMSDYGGEEQPKPRRYRVTGKECPLKVRGADGTAVRYDKGDEIAHDEFPVAHISVPNALRRGLIEEV